MSIFRSFCLCLIVSMMFSSAYALEPEPFKWSHMPIDTNFGGVAYVKTDGDIFLDPVLELEDVTMDLDTWAVKYIRTFDFFGKSARIDFTQAYQEGYWKGLLKGEQASTRRNGASDTFVRVAANLYGAPSLGLKEFAQYKAQNKDETIVGVAVALRLPTGDYQKDRLINLSNNRYTIRPHMGVQHNTGPWTFELTGEVAFFTDNNSFYNGNKLEQDPLYITHGHVIYHFKPGLWIGLSGGYDYGGETTVNGVEKDNRQQNTGWAVSFAYPINKLSGIKLAYIRSQTEENTGIDTESIALAGSLLW